MFKFNTTEFFPLNSLSMYAILDSSSATQVVKWPYLFSTLLVFSKLWGIFHQQAGATLCFPFYKLLTMPFIFVYIQQIIIKEGLGM